MKDKNIYEPIFDGYCEVCGQKMKKDIYKQGDCPHCGWHNCFLNEEKPNAVAMPNIISLNKARQLYTQGKKFEPNLDEFVQALNAYGEMQFEFNGVYYAVEFVHSENNDTKIELYNSKTKEEVYFKDCEDFKNTAKVEGKLLKDVWEQTTDRYWLQ